ncbi:RmlC-like cupin domain-containing protein [Hyaloraphidium curvatum]|nr:RmlC-like cupin domain-containing protein [Hyaloraphidium curvatum]
MAAPSQPEPTMGHFVSFAGIEWESDEGHYPGVRWKTLFSSDRTPTAKITQGICEIPPGRTLILHHHAQTETYWCLSGSAEVRVGDLPPRTVKAGEGVWIPGDAPHRTHTPADATEPFVFLYTFATDSFLDVCYHYDE